MGAELAVPQVGTGDLAALEDWLLGVRTEMDSRVRVAVQAARDEGDQDFREVIRYAVRLGEVLGSIGRAFSDAAATAEGEALVDYRDHVDHADEPRSELRVTDPLGRIKIGPDIKADHVFDRAALVAVLVDHVTRASDTSQEVYTAEQMAAAMQAVGTWSPQITKVRAYLAAAGLEDAFDTVHSAVEKYRGLTVRRAGL